MANPRIVIKRVGKSIKSALKININSRPKEIQTLDPRVLIGDCVYWEPSKESQPLNNFGILVTGDSGVGKTQMLRALIHEVSVSNLPICILDFKNDYAPHEFSHATGMSVCNVNRRGLPFNPFALIPDASGECRPLDGIYEFAEILNRSYGLGVQQHAILRNSIIASYEEMGIDTSKYMKVNYNTRVPTFDSIWDKLTKPVRNRLSMLYDLKVFPGGTDSFEELASRQIILNLSGLPNDKIRSALAELLIVRLHGHIMKGPQPGKLTKLLVIDEAWRVGQSERLQHLAREGRAFGVGIAIGTQFPGDIPEDLAGNLATSLFFHNSKPKHRKTIGKILGESKTEVNDVAVAVGALKKHEAFIRNQQYVPYTKVSTIPHYRRRSFGTF